MDKIYFMEYPKSERLGANLASVARVKKVGKIRGDKLRLSLRSSHLFAKQN